MRRWMFAFAAFAGFVCGLTGCHHTAGVCDCEMDYHPCASHAPWCGFHHVAPVAPVGAVIQPENLQQIPGKLNQ